MATKTSGDKGRTDVSSRSKPDLMGSGKFNRIRTHNATKAMTFYTGSQAGAKGFIIETASDCVIKPAMGVTIPASVLTGSLDAVFEIGLDSISGSGKIHVLY